jgi:hypothetical protein
MKQISTGAGLVALAVGMVATAFIVSQRGGEAFAQGTGGERRIVAQGAYGGDSYGWGYRIWSDNVTEVKYLGTLREVNGPDGGRIFLGGDRKGYWQTVDTGTAAFFASDVDRSGSVDSGDISAVLLDFNQATDPTTPPPIDCNINAPR